MSGFYTAIVLVAASAYESEQSRKAQNKANRQEKRRAAAENLRERKQAYRQMLIQQAQMQAAGTNLGVAGSSGVAGGIASIGSQTASNIGFQFQLEALNNKRLAALNSAANHQAMANNFSSAASFVSGASNSGMFGSNQPTTTKQTTWQK
jgi:hypothetical protein